jgi:hypothetical protein
MINLIDRVRCTLQSLKSKLLSQAMLGFVTAVILVATTACDGTEVASKSNLDNPPPGTITELYKPITPEVGGMNKYSDIDPRIDTSKVDAKAERLIKKAKNSEGRDINPLENIKKEFDRKGIQERVKDTADSVSKSAQETVDGISKGTSKGLANLKENTSSFKDEIKESAKNGY